jgi:hypothetical protein
VPDVFRFCARHLEQLAAKVDASRLKTKFLEGVETVEKLLQRIRLIVPATTREKLDDFVAYLGTHKQRIGNALGQFTQPIRTILMITAKRLDDHAWVAFTQTSSKHWIAPISQQGAMQLINKHPPKWVRMGDMKHPGPTDGAARAKSAELAQQIAHRRKAGKDSPPEIGPDVVQTFERDKIRPDAIRGPAKLYRIVDPTSSAGGVFWVDEKTFHSLKSRDDWRAKLAVKPEWNQNGQYVVYEIAVGETVHVWRGPAASQKLEGTPYHLTGGTDQIVFHPNPDTFSKTRPRVDPGTGQELLGRGGKPDTRVEWTDVTDRKVVAPIRDRPTDAHVKGPYETNWGYADWSPEEAKRIILALPDDIQ